VTQKYDKERMYPRYPIPTLVDLEFEDGTYRHEFSGNIGEGGMYLYTEKPLPIGTTATLRFAMPNLDWVFEIKAKSTSSVIVTMDQRMDGKKDGHGFQFLSMDEQDRQKLKTYFENFKIEDLEL